MARNIRFCAKIIRQLTAGSRQIFAFSRDGGLPLSRVLYYISNRTHSPVRCVWFATFVALLLGLLAFAGANAIGAIFSLAVTAQYFAYSISISARFLGGTELKPGPFSLGKYVGGNFECAGAIKLMVHRAVLLL